MPKALDPTIFFSLDTEILLKLWGRESGEGAKTQVDCTPLHCCIHTHTHTHTLNNWECTQIKTLLGGKQQQRVHSFSKPGNYLQNCCTIGSIEALYGVVCFYYVSLKGNGGGGRHLRQNLEPITLGLNCFFLQKNILLFLFCRNSWVGVAAAGFRTAQKTKHLLFPMRPLLCWTPHQAPQCFCSLCLFTASSPIKK